MRGYSSWSRTELNKALQTRPVDCHALEIYAHSRKDASELKRGESIPTEYINCHKFKVNDDFVLDVQPDCTGVNHLYAKFHKTETVDEAIGWLTEIDSDVELLHFVWE